MQIQKTVDQGGVSSAALVSFCEKPQLLTPQTTDKQLLLRQLQDLQFSPQLNMSESSVSSTHLTQALNYAMLALSQRARKDSVPIINCFLSASVKFDAKF